MVPWIQRLVMLMFVCVFHVKYLQLFIILQFGLDGSAESDPWIQRLVIIVGDVSVDRDWTEQH